MLFSRGPFSFISDELRLFVKYSIFFYILAFILGVGNIRAQEVQSPAEFIGHKMGADRRLADWDQLLEYYRHLDAESPRLKLVELGLTTLGRRHQGGADHVSGLNLAGNTFVVLFISAPENLQRLEKLRQLSETLTDPRGASEAQVQRAIEEGKAVVTQSYGLHSDEVAASQTAAEVAYEQVTREDEKMQRIRENTISIIFPSFNPDGTTMIAEWYRKTKGTDYEGVEMPWLYHHYVGHDNNRDAYMQNIIESRHIGEILFRKWVPQAYIDHHEMGNNGPRFYVPPYSEPIRPKGDPLVWREMDWYGAHVAYSLEQKGHSGVSNDVIFSGWGHFGWHWITPFHNTAGMLTEAARTGRLATPTYFHPDQMEGSPNRSFPYHGEQISYPNPWEGGWWRVRDIVELQKHSSIAALDIAARNREKVLRNAYEKASRQIERGADEEGLAAYVIPADQHDPLTAKKMINRLLWQGVDVHRAEMEFTHKGRVYGPGTYVVPMSQPKRGVIRWLLGRTFYPDNSFTRDDDGNPIWPYDLATHTMYEFMEVDVKPLDDAPAEGALSPLESELDPEGNVEMDSAGGVLDGRLNDSFHAANLLLKEGLGLRRVDDPPEESGLRPGDFLVPEDAESELLARAADSTGVDVQPLETEAGGETHVVERPAVGMYRPYYGGNMDEGWTRMLLENFGFSYDSLRDEDVTSSSLSETYNIVVLPEMNLETMLGPGMEDWKLKPPQQYRSGFGEEGVDSLRSFVRDGGTLLTFGNSGDLPLNHFDLPVENVVEGSAVERSGYDAPPPEDVEFWAPGSTLRTNVDNTDPLAYGMPERAYALFWRNNQVYETKIGPESERIRRPMTYGEGTEEAGGGREQILQSGWLIGGEHIAEKAAVVSVPYGEGQVVMIGFRPQFRHTTHGTFKLVFNALLEAAR
jgi:hypothetical protein